MTRNKVKPNGLQAKDLINIGIFSALYIVVFFTTGMLGYIPILMLFIPMFCPLVAGVVFMLFLTKVQKFGMVTIMGTILSMFMFLTGHPWPVIPIGVLCAFIADLILKLGNYKSWGKIVLGYVCFSELLIGLLVPIFFMRETYFAIIRDGYGDTYADALLKYTPIGILPIILLITAIGAVIGAYIGKALLKKHFKRAGIA